MEKSSEKVLFITSFLPVTVFKIIARVGDADLKQAKLAVVAGLILAIIQYVLARRILKYNTYMEKAFLGFLLVGTGWVFVLSGNWAYLFVDNSVALLYFTLFLMAILPQLFGYDPFTYAIAKQWYPESVWGMPDFRTINIHITYVWATIFFLAFLSSAIGQGKPLFSIVIPLIMVLGIGVVFSKKYPDYYLKRKYQVSPKQATSVPATVAELIEGMPRVFNPSAAVGLSAEIQFNISGGSGGNWVVSIADGACQVKKGESMNPALVIESPGDVWIKIARGEIDRPKAFMEGLYKARGDMKLLLQMPQLFGPRKEEG